MSFDMGRVLDFLCGTRQRLPLRHFRCTFNSKGSWQQAISLHDSCLGGAWEEATMSDFAVWLKNLDPGSNSDLEALKEFAQSSAAEWPFNSNEIRDYIAVVNAKAPNDATRSALLSALADAFVQWKMANQMPASGFWSRIGLRLGPIALALSGILIAAVLIYGVFFHGDFLSIMAKADQARGLITFLFSISTIAVFLLIAIATFWIKKDEVEERFSKAKDLLTVMIGIFGTILGFYYGSLPETKDEQPQGAGAGSPATSSLLVDPGGQARAATWTAGGLPPGKYELYVFESDKPTDTGPAGFAKPASMNFTLVVRDANGAQANAADLLVVKPQADSQ
jgi:hypothetical protein